jgi:hypothetical protein
MKVNRLPKFRVFWAGRAERTEHFKRPARIRNFPVKRYTHTPRGVQLTAFEYAIVLGMLFALACLMSIQF